SDSSFSLPPVRYFKRHQREPFGFSSRYRPPPSASFCGLSAGLALRMAVSDSGMGVTPCGGKPVTPEVTPCYPRMAMDGLGLHRAQQRPDPLLLLGFPASIGLRWSCIWWVVRDSNPGPID